MIPKKVNQILVNYWRKMDSLGERHKKIENTVTKIREYS